MSRVERVVGGLQQIGDHEYRVGACHRHNPDREPARRRDACDQGAERHATERREQDARALADERAAIGPRQDEQRHDQQRQARAGAVHQPTERERGQQRDRDQCDIRQCLRACLFSERTHHHETDDRERRNECP
jgi:hypothetical protein